MVTRALKRGEELAQLAADRAAADHDDPVGDLPHSVASRLVHSGTRSSPSTGGTAASEPVATITCSAVRICPSTSTVPGPVMRPVPLTTVAPCF
jgi:hypothetical protein